MDGFHSYTMDEGKDELEDLGDIKEKFESIERDIFVLNQRIDSIWMRLNANETVDSSLENSELHLCYPFSPHIGKVYNINGKREMWDGKFWRRCSAEESSLSDSELSFEGEEQVLLNFPKKPIRGKVYNVNLKKYVWNGISWERFNENKLKDKFESFNLR